MAKKSLENELEVAISNLRSERAQLLGRVSEIDASFARLGINVAVIKGAPAAAPAAAPTVTGKRRGRPPKAATAAAAAPAAPVTGKKKPGPKPKKVNAVGVTAGGRQRFAISGDESILAFVASHGQPNSGEVNGHWSKEGRKGKADNSITKLVKAGKLTRISVEGERGGRYKIA